MTEEEKQDKNKESALLSAMADKEERMRREGVAIANKLEAEATGLANAAITKASGEAKAIMAINDALKEAQNNPLFIQVKSLEVETRRIEQWDGSVPNFLMGGDGGGFVPMIQIPATE